MEAASAARELDRESLRAAELGFFQLLRRKRISESFLARHGEDLFGQAQKEYAAWTAGGNTATNPVGWLINCAWRRTQDLLGEMKRRPQAVSVEEAYFLADTDTPGPEEQAVEQDLRESLQQAMTCLPGRDRKLLELVYFEGFDVFAAGRQLGWTKSTAHRHHDAALKRLRAVLPDDVGGLEIEIGLAAWVSIVSERSGWSLPNGAETLVQGAHDTAEVSATDSQSCGASSRRSPSQATPVLPEERHAQPASAGRPRQRAWPAA